MDRSRYHPTHVMSTADPTRCIVCEGTSFECLKSPCIPVKKAPEPALHGHPRFYDLLNEMSQLHSAKNHDYTDGRDPFLNLRQCEAMGIPAWKGVIVRLGDKFSRIQNFAKREILAVPSESIRDTFLDNAVYSLIALILFEETQCGSKPATNPQPSKHFSIGSIPGTYDFITSLNDMPKTFPNHGSAVSQTTSEMDGPEEPPPPKR